MLTPKSPKTKSDFQSDNWEKREKTSWCSSVCVSEQNGPLPDVRNPFNLLCPCAPMAAGAVYTDCLTTQCTWRTTSRWRFEVVNSDSSPGRKLNNKQQVSWSTCGRTVRAFGGHPLTDLQLFLGQWLLRRRPGSVRVLGLLTCSYPAWIYSWFICLYEEKATRRRTFTDTPAPSGVPLGRIRTVVVVFRSCLLKQINFLLVEWSLWAGWLTVCQGKRDLLIHMGGDQ